MKSYVIWGGELLMIPDNSAFSVKCVLALTLVLYTNSMRFEIQLYLQSHGVGYKGELEKTDEGSYGCSCKVSICSIR